MTVNYRQGANYRPEDGRLLFSKLFMVRMPYLQTRNIDELRFFGMRVSGIASIDQERATEMITTELTIDQMFEKWRSGVTVRVINYRDCETIYRIIQAHILTWADRLATGINIGNAPLKDLIELDEYATLVYDKAKGVFNETARKTAIASNFTKIQTLNFFNILQKEYRPQMTNLKLLESGVEVSETPSVASTSTVQERPSFKSLFEEKVNQISTWRGNG